MHVSDIIRPLLSGRGLCKPKMLNVPRTYRDANGSLVSDSEFTWEDAKQKIENDDIVFGRSSDGSRKYKENMSVIKEKWDTIDSYCKHYFLEYPYSTKMKNGKTVKYVEETAISPVEGEMTLHANDYPYNLTSNIKHYVIWAVNSKPISTYKSFVEKTFPSSHHELMIFENIEQNKSVKSVVHVHVLIREKPLIIVPELPLLFAKM